MASGEDLKRIARARLRSAEALLNAGDWDGSAYMLAHVLECALKAVTCKTLRLGIYPSNIKSEQHFLTHNFDQLLTLSGLSDILSITGNVDIFRNWSEFTQEFPGNWVSMRYNISHQNNFDEKKVRTLLNNLTEKPGGIISVLNSKRKW